MRLRVRPCSWQSFVLGAYKRCGMVKLVKFNEITAKVKQFLSESKAELKKVTWPTRKQAIASTAVVIVVVAIISIFLSLVDFGLTKIIKIILG